MAIAELPASPNGEITHGDLREKTNEIIQVVNPLDENKATSRIYVSNDSQMPNVVGGVSTPDPDTEIFFNNGAVLTVRINVINAGVSFTGNGVFSSGVTYTGTDDFITVDNQSVAVSDLSILAMTSTNIFNCTALTGTIFTLNIDKVRLVTPQKIGTMNGMALVATNHVALNFTDGWSFDGTNLTGFRCDGGFMVDNNVNATHFDWASATFQGLDFLGIKMRGIGKYFNSDNGGEGNIINNVEAVVYNCAFGNGSGTALTGFSDGFFTNNWNFRDNSPDFATEDSGAFGEMFMTGLTAGTPEVVTVAAQDTYYELGTLTTGTYTTEESKRFVVNSAGYLQYTGSKTIQVEASLSVLVEKVGGGSDYIGANIAKNWTAGSSGEIGSASATDNPTPAQISCKKILNLSPNDTIRAVFANFGSTADIQVYIYQLVIR